MAVYSVVRLNELERVKRLDAEYYRPEYLNLISKLKFKKSLFFRDLLEKIIHPKEIKREYSDNGFLFLLAQNIRPGFLDLSEKRYISEEVAKTMKQNFLNKGDILFVRTGVVGNVAIYLEASSKVLASSHILIARPNFKISPCYLMVFFNTNIGRNLITRGIYGGVQPEIAPDYLKTILVPIVSKDFEKRVDKIVFNSYQLLKQSEFFYTQAETLLLEELGLKDYRPEYKKAYTARLSNCFTAKRMDAEYFQPAYEEVIEKVKDKGIELRPLKDFVLAFKKGVEVGSENYQEKGKLFIRVSNLSIQGLVDRDQKYINDEIYQQYYSYKPKVGDFLLTKDATPGIAYVLKEDVEGIIASGILNLTIDELKIDKEYLALCINSLIGKKQVERDGGGSVIVHWKPEQIKNLKIPLLPFPIQKQIAELIQKSHASRKQAKELLETAKKAVEMAIEKNEEEAIKFLETKNISSFS